MLGKKFWWSFGLSLAVYLAGIAIAVLVIPPPKAPVEQRASGVAFDGYRPDCREDLTVLVAITGEEEPLVFLVGFCPAEEGVLVYSLDEGLMPVGQTPEALLQAVKAELDLPIDYFLVGQGSDMPGFVQGMGSAVVELAADATVQSGGQRVQLRAGRQLLNGELSLGVLYSAPELREQVFAAWCGQFFGWCASRDTEKVLARLRESFDTNLTYDALARRMQGVRWLEQQQGGYRHCLGQGTREEAVAALGRTAGKQP